VCKCRFNGNCHAFAHLMCPKTLFFGGQNMEGNFQKFFLVKAILGIPCSQIETKKIFSIAGTFTSHC
jgi:hypothetical protein